MSAPTPDQLRALAAIAQHEGTRAIPYWDDVQVWHVTRRVIRERPDLLPALAALAEFDGKIFHKAEPEHLTHRWLRATRNGSRGLRRITDALAAHGLNVQPAPHWPGALDVVRR